MKVIRIDAVDKINFDNSTLKDSSFLNLLLETWKNTSYEEVIEKL